MTLEDLNKDIEASALSLAGGTVAGYVGAIQKGDETVTHAVGVANLNTGAAMTPDTGWLLGSVTKVLTATMILRLVDQGRVDLDAPALRYVPEFRLKDEAAAEAILVRHLIDHTNGIDADALMPTREFGPAMVKSYVDALAQRGVLFPAGTFTHYTNPGFVLAGRIIEHLEGITFNEAIERDLYGPLGMKESCTSATQAILRRTAIGAFAGGPDGALTPTPLFMLPVSAAPAGATPIVTVLDLVAFAKMHLDGGVAADGSRYLSADAVRRMQTVAFDLKTPNSAPTGLGWRIVPIAGTFALCHGGGSPGGTSSLAVFPEHDLIITGFATGPGSTRLHDAVVSKTLTELLGLTIEAPFETGAAPEDLSPYEGVFRQFQNRLDVKAVDGKLQVQAAFEPFDAEHERFLSAYTGGAGAMAPPPLALEPLNSALFKPAGAPDEMFYGIWGRMALQSFHNPDASGRFGFHHSGWRAARRA